MMYSVSGRIGRLDFDFEHLPVKIVANRNCPEIKLAGFSVGPFDEGGEYEIFYWVAAELEKSGVVHFREDESLNVIKLNKLQWTERVQSAVQMSKLPDDFYPKLRRCLSGLKRDARAPEKMLENEKAKQLSKDIVSARLRKIVSMASAPAQTEQTLKNLTAEERFLYDKLYTLVNEWRTHVSRCDEAAETE